MTLVDPFGDQSTVNATAAANGIGSLLRAIGGGVGAGGGTSINYAAGGSTPAPTGAAPTGAVSTSGPDSASPVPEGTGVSQGFGVNGHPGIDLAVPDGTKITAAISGKVTHAALDDPGGYGQWIEITGADGTVTRYGHLSGLDVKEGDTIKAGQVIGTSGGQPGEVGAGNSTGAHLHFEVRQNGQPADPTPWLAGGHPIVNANPSQVTASIAPAVTTDAAVATGMNRLGSVIAGKGDPGSGNAATASSGTASHPGATSNTGNFAADVLAGIGAPNTPDNLRVIEAWMRAEGGADHNNPLNTTQGAPGATDFNSVGVKTYTSYQQGVQATVETLLNGRYQNIIDALKAGHNAKAVADAIAASPWGTGALVQQIIGGG